MDDIVDDVVEDGVGLFSGVSHSDRCVQAASRQSPRAIYQFGHVVKILRVASDYDTGLGEVVAGRHFEVAPEA